LLGFLALCDTSGLCGKELNNWLDSRLVVREHENELRSFYSFHWRSQWLPITALERRRGIFDRFFATKMPRLALG
jgi:hypothetical protein